MKEQTISYPTAVLAYEKGFKYPGFWMWSPEAHYNEDCPQSVLQKWLRDEHYMFITIIKEIIGSDEWVFAYRLDYLPKEHWEAKRRCLHFQVKESYNESPGGTYWGGWNTYEEALENSLKHSLELL